MRCDDRDVWGGGGLRDGGPEGGDVCIHTVGSRHRTAETNTRWKATMFQRKMNC